MGPTSQVIEQNTSFNLCALLVGLRCLAIDCSPERCSHVELRWSDSSDSRSSPEIQVSISPQTAQVVLGAQVKFSATVSGSGLGVSWSVNGIAGGNATVGVIDNTGLYTAPNALPVPNTVTVTAASVADPTQSATASVTIVNPVPAISSISPATLSAGSGGTTLTVTGTGFSPQSVVEVGGTPLATTYWNPTVLTTVVSAAQLADGESLSVTVTTPTPGGGTSNAVPLPVGYPAPTISSISPVTIYEVSSDTQLTVTGSGFIPQSTLEVNGAAIPSTFVSNTQLTATLPVLMLAQSAVFSIVVSNPAPGGGTSSAATLSVLAQGAVSATGNPQVALYSFASTQSGFRVHRVWNGYDLWLAYLGAEYAGGRWGRRDSCRRNAGKYHLSHAGGCKLPGWHPVY